MPAPEDTENSPIARLMESRDVEENFRLLFDQYYPAVWGFFSRRGFGPEDCRDLTQEVFVAVYSGIDTLRSESAFVAWLFSIARHMMYRQMDRRKRLFVVTGAAAAGGEEEGRRIESVPEPGPDALSRMLDEERIAALREAIGELPGRVQDCLRARLVDGLNNRQIGERFGISENTVAVHVHRGMKNLRTKLREFFRGTPIPEDV